ncbi:MAG: tetratricopeptide repeat protein [Saprospiraceae bacterium]
MAHRFRLAVFAFLPFFSFLACQDNTAPDSDSTFFEHQNAAHNGDYLATYPLSNADSCVARLKAEVPPSLQPWGCLSIWYHMPRTNPAVNFRLLELYEENYMHDTVTAFAQMVRGEFYVDLAQFDSARICLTDAYQRYTRLGRPLDASDATYVMARSYVYQNNFADALKNYFEVLDLLNVHDTTFSHRRATLYQDIAVAYERSNNRPQFLSWLQKNWDADYSKLDNAWRYRARTASNLCTYYLKTDPDSSLFWVNMALDIFKQNNEAAAPPARLIYWLARAYFVKGECDTALPYFLDAYRRNPDKSNLFGYYQFGMTLGDCYLCTGKLDSAEIYLKESLASPDTGNLAATHNLLGDVYAKRGDWKRAFDEVKESRRLFEIKFTADKAKEVAELEARYENAQQERRILELEQERKSTIQQNTIIALLAMLALGFSASLYLRQRGRHRILEQENELLEQDKKLLEQEKELAEARELLKDKALERSQTELHQSNSALKTTKEELDTTSRLLALKNHLIEELQMRLNTQHLAPPEETTHGPMESNSLRSLKILTDTDWVHFRQQFEQSFPGFLNSLKKEYPRMTAAETRLFLLLKLDFDKIEIAETLGISPESVMRSRRRLSNKLGLAETADLDNFIQAFTVGETFTKKGDT